MKIKNVKDNFLELEDASNEEIIEEIDLYQKNNFNTTKGYNHKFLK